MEIFILVFLIIALFILPLQLAARWINARNTDALSCLFALVAAAVIQLIAKMIAPEAMFHYGILLTLPLTAIAYRWVLGTTFWKGILISIAQIAIIMVCWGLMVGFLSVLE